MAILTWSMLLYERMCLEIMEANAKWNITEDEKRKYINALAEELPSLRAKVGVPQDELAKIIGVSRQTYGDVERRAKIMSWSTFLSLILFFDGHSATHDFLRSLPAFPYELFSRFNDGINPGDFDLNKIIGITDENLFSKLDEQAIYTIRTLLMVEYARCTKLSSETVIKSFDGRLLNMQVSQKDILIRETLHRIRGFYQ